MRNGCRPTTVRLQCYEGLDESKALYEWKYGKQLLYTQLLKEQLGNVLEVLKGSPNLWRDCASSVMSLLGGFSRVATATQGHGRTARRRATDR